MGVPRYRLNENYFKEVDTPKKAYWVGFISADGYIHQMTKTKLRLVIELSSKDESVLFQFIADLESDIPVQRRSNKSSFGSESSFISITRYAFVQPLIELGVKTETIFSKIPGQFKPDFIRGIFDGDGCLHLETYNPIVCGFNAKQYRWILASSHFSLLEDIQLFLIEKCGVSATKILFQKVWKLKYSGNRQVQKINDIINPEGSICLMERKAISPV